MASRNRSPRLILTALACSVLAACGSQVPPSEFIGYQNGRPNGNGAAPTAGSTGGVDPQGNPTGGTSLPNAPGANPTKAGSNPTGANPGSNPTGGSGPLPPGVHAASCAGFKNTTGISNSTITIANASDLSGPVPGLFKSAQQAVQAYISYFNSTSSICGRKLKLDPLDSQTSTGGDQQAASSACGAAFAMVGSMSAFDSGGANTVTSCGIPDIRASSTETARYKAPVTFGAYSLAVNEIPLAPFNWFKSNFGDAYKHAAYLYLNAGASSLNAGSFQQGEQQVGYNWVYKQGIDVTTFNYAPYVQAMKDKGVKYVQYTGAYQNAIRLKQAMSSQNFNPVFVMDAVGYDQGFVSSGGSAVNGTYLFLAGPMFEEKDRNPEMQNYLTWLQRTSPGAVPSFFGVFAWGAAALFTQQALQLGGQLTRQSLIASLHNVHNYTDNKFFNPQDPGGRHTGACQSVVQLQGGKWVRKTPYPYTCGPVAKTNVGS